MTLFHRDISTELLFAGRLFASSFWLVALILAVKAIKAKAVADHKAWMIRAYAITMPAATLAIVLLPMVLIMGEEGHEMLFEFVQVLAWPLHLAIAELIIRRSKPAKKQLPVILSRKAA